TALAARGAGSANGQRAPTAAPKSTAINAADVAATSGGTTSVFVVANSTRSAPLEQAGQSAHSPSANLVPVAAAADAVFFQSTDDLLSDVEPGDNKVAVGSQFAEFAADFEGDNVIDSIEP